MAKYDFTNAVPFNEQPLYKQGYEDAIDKACEVYEKELREIVRFINGLRKGVGDCISIEGCIKDFRKTMEEE